MTVSIPAKVLVVDLEGTTSAAGFILGDLYDYARPRLLPWLREHSEDEAVQQARQQTIQEAGLPDDADDEAIVAALHGFMDQDVKSTPLKTLQGQIWAEGFRRREISSHFFDDVIPKLREWRAAGIQIACFSSGSVTSQRPWFEHSPAGDLTPLVIPYFDTVNAGPKKEAASYEKIAAELGRPAEDLVFFTDHPDEVKAARAAGWKVVAFSRPGEPWFGADHGDVPVVSSFDEVEVTVA